MIEKHVNKYCIDDDAEKTEYEALLNNPDVMILEKKEIQGVGRRPRSYVIIHWCTDVIE